MKTKLLILIMVMMHQNMFSQTLAEKDSKYLSLLERFNFPLMGAVFELKDFRDVKGTFSINAPLYEFLDAFKSQTGISVEVHSKLKTDNKFVQALDFDNYWGNSSGNEEAPTFYVNAIAEIAKELDDGRYEYFIQLTILPNDNLSGSHLLQGDKFIAMTTYLTDSVPKTTTYLSSMYLNIFVENALRKYADVKEVKKSETRDNNKIFPWMNSAITEAKAMNGVNECNAPLFSKGKLYHREGGHCGFCPCGDKKHTNYCDPSAWCASFANWCLRQSKTSYTKSAGSQTFLNSGDFVQISNPVFGAIAVFTNLDAHGNFKTTGHVAFVVGLADGNNILCLGGNQGGKIKVSWYSLEQDKKRMIDKLYFRGYYLPKAYSNKLKDYQVDVQKYTNAASANNEIINLQITNTENESTR